MKAAIVHFIDSFGPWLAAAGVGGAVDYADQVTRGVRRFNWLGLITHLSSALFFGWLCGTTVSGLGYPEYLSHGAAGLGGFLGVRATDLVTNFFGKMR